MLVFAMGSQFGHALNLIYACNFDGLEFSVGPKTTYMFVFAMGSRFWHAPNLIYACNWNGLELIGGPKPTTSVCLHL